MEVKGQWINVVLYGLFYSLYEDETSTSGFSTRLGLGEAMILNFLYPKDVKIFLDFLSFPGH